MACSITTEKGKTEKYPIPFYPGTKPTELQKAIMEHIVFDSFYHKYMLKAKISKRKKALERRIIALEVLRALEHVYQCAEVLNVAYIIKYSLSKDFYRRLFDETTSQKK